MKEGSKAQPCFWGKKLELEHKDAGRDGMEGVEILGLPHWKEGFEESRTGDTWTWQGAIASSCPLSRSRSRKPQPMRQRSPRQRVGPGGKQSLPALGVWLV